MLTVEELICLDHRAWLHTQQRVADQLGYSQSQVCRIERRCLKTLKELGLPLSQRHCHLYDDDLGLLSSLRRIHQVLRFEQRRGLRLQTTTWLRHLVLEPAPPGWSVNPAPLHATNDCSSVELVEARVIDAALVTGPETPHAAHPNLCSITLSQHPLLLLVPGDHALAREGGLSQDDIKGHSELAHSSFINTRCREVMEVLDTRLLAATTSSLTGLQGEPPPHARRFGTAMTCLIRPDLVPIDFQVPRPAADVLVMHRDWIDHPGAAELLTLLREQLQGLQKQIPALTLPS